jgi:hypothetical protein
MPQDNRDPNQPKLANKFRHDRTTQGARPMKPLMDSMPRPKRYGAPPKIRLLVPRPKTLRNVPVFDRAGLAPKI